MAKSIVLDSEHQKDRDCFQKVPVDKKVCPDSVEVKSACQREQKYPLIEKEGKSTGDTMGSSGADSPCISVNTIVTDTISDSVSDNS